jgi:DNA-directed RNA polymerase subunit H (RpoH/RPB5)
LQMNPEDQQEARNSIICENIMSMLHIRQYQSIVTHKSYGVVGDSKSKWLKAVVGGWSCIDREKKATICIMISSAEKATSRALSDLRDELGKYNHIIVIYIGSPPKALQKIFSSDPDKYFEMIKHRVFMLNLMNHDETEKSRIVPDNSDDFAVFQRIMSMNSEKLTKKSITDPMIIWIGAKVGDVIVTNRIYESSQIQTIYELVISPVESESGDADDDAEVDDE